MRALIGFACVATLIIISLAGCGGSDASAPDATPQAAANPAANAATNQAAGTPVQSNEGPREVIERYLDAVKVGDAETTTALLTAFAQQRAEESNIDVTPPGSESATFEVGRVEYINDAKDAVHVESRWMETDASGTVQSLQSVWVLAKEEPGWRIAGVFVALFPGEPPLILDYEQPEEVVRKLELARQEMVRRSQQPTGEVLQAQTPDATGGAPR